MLHCTVSESECCLTCLRLYEIQSKIRDCREPLDQLYIEEEHAKFVVNAAHDPITRRLPLEFVSNIFKLINDDDVH